MHIQPWSYMYGACIFIDSILECEITQVKKRNYQCTVNADNSSIKLPMHPGYIVQWCTQCCAVGTNTNGWG